MLVSNIRVKVRHEEVMSSVENNTKNILDEKMLADFGYGNPVHLNDDIYAVDSIGIHLPGIEPIDDNPYGTIIKKAREEKGLSLKALADAAATTPHFAMEVENGGEWFSNIELSSVGRVLDLNTIELLKGNREKRTTNESIKEMLNSLNDTMREFYKIQNDMLSILDRLSSEKRFIVKTEAKHFDKESPYLKEYQAIEFLIVDKESGEYACDENGNILRFKTAAEAFEVSTQYNFYPEEAVSKINERSGEIPIQNHGIRIGEDAIPIEAEKGLYFRR